jgi:hypothetical protein
MIQRIISSGQTGVDRGALEAALDLGMAIGGWIPKGGRAEDGTVPDRFRKSMWESESTSYLERTRLNVEDSQATLVITWDERLSPGSARTIDFARNIGNAYHHLALTVEGRFNHALRWLGQLAVYSHPFTLNVAGTRESKSPGIQAVTRATLVRAFTLLRPQ